jgi:predicted metal-dependent peptidase
MIDNNLAKISKKLLMDEPFFGMLLLGINKYSNDDIPTACVSLDGINPSLHVNFEFFNKLKNDDERKAVLKHECLHIGYMHLIMYSEFKNKEIFNIAADIEVNQYIENLPEEFIFIEDIEKKLNINLKRKAGTKYYYEKLLKFADKIKNIQIDHPLWKKYEKLTDSNKSLIQRQIEKQLREAYENSKSTGNIPGELKNYLNELLNPPPPTVNWRQVLKRFTNGSYEVYTKKSRRKESKRFVSNPGLKIKNKLYGLVAIDTSGSISNKDLRDFLSQIDYIVKSGTKIDLLQFDCKFQDISKYRKNEIRVKIHGRGGTDFDPPIKYYNENRNKYGFMVMFTDGEAPLPKVKPNKPMMWVITSNGEIDQNYPYYKIKMN